MSEVIDLEQIEEQAGEAESFALTPEQFARLESVDAVFADEHSMGKRYKQVRTHKLVTALCETGQFEVSRARLTKTRTNKTPGKTLKNPLHAKHEVVLRRADVGKFDVGGGDMIVPEFIITNSHNGTSSLNVEEGAYRFRCDNGLVIGTTFAQMKIRHAGDAAEQAIARVMRMSRSTGKWLQEVEAWKKIELDRAERMEFARLAATLRYGDANRFQPENLLCVRREGDDSGDLWTTFNSIQENAMKGGFQGLASTGRRATARPLTEIVKAQTFNADLWVLADEIAQDHRAITV